MGIIRFNVAGVYYYKDGVRAAAKKRKDFALSEEEFRVNHSNGKKVFQYYFSRGSSVALIPEPNNPHDPNAVAVYVNGIQVGHVPAELAPDMRSVLNAGYSAEAFLSGGPRRWVEGSDVLTDSSNMEIAVTVDSPAISDVRKVNPGNSHKASNRKSRTVALILCIFFGYFGAHYFYTGQIGKGLLYFFTVGLFCVGWIFDIFRILSGRFKV